MFRVGVRGHLMIAHSFQGAVFGPAQKLHGATFVVDVELCRENLNEFGIVCDIGALIEVLGEVLAVYNYQNLDEVESLKGLNTTTEVMARRIHEDMSAMIASRRLGEDAVGMIKSMKVTLSESHIAWASYEADV